MKKKLLLSMEEELIKSIKCVAVSEGTTVSELMSDYIKAINKNRNVIKAIRDINK